MKRLLVITLLSCLLLTGCSKKETINIKDDKLNYSTTFSYEKEDGFKFDKEIEGGKYKEVEFTNKKLNLSFDMYYSTNTLETYKSLKDIRSHNKYYKEYKFNEYDAYVSGDNDSNLDLIILLKEDMKENETIELFSSINQIKNKKGEVVFDTFNKDEVLNFFKSIKLEVGK